MDSAALHRGGRSGVWAAKVWEKEAGEEKYWGTGAFGGEGVIGGNAKISFFESIDG